MILKPYGRRLIVRRDVKEKIGSIIVPETAKKTPLIGTVLAVGPECVYVEVGEKIIFGRFGFYEPPDVDGEFKGCLIINEDDVLASVMDNKPQILEEVSNA